MVFAGQGSQSVGMQAALADRFPVVRETYAEASDWLGYDLWSLVQEGPEAQLNETVVTQPAMLVAGVAAWRVWQGASGPEPLCMAGHSLGEYTALVCAGAIEFAAAVPLVVRRAQLMQDAVPSEEAAMAALIGLDDDAVQAVCQEASEQGVVEAVNFNAPGQVVISGRVQGVDRAIELAKAAGARRALKLSVSVPSHSSLMKDAAASLVDDLARVDIRTPQITVIGSTDVAAYAAADEIRDALKRQLHSPVQWVNTVHAMLGAGANMLVECGPGKVLTGLSRRISRPTPAICLDSADALTEALS